MRMKTRWTNDIRWTWLGLVLCIFLLVLMGVLFIPPKPTPYPDYMTESPSPSGTKAFYTLLKNRFDQVEMWKKPAGELPFLDSPQIMIMVQPDHPMDRTEEKEWIQWVEAGNRLWLLTDHPKGFFQWKMIMAGEGTAGEVRTVVGTGPMSGTYEAIIPTDMRLQPRQNDTILLKDSLGVIALSRTFGKGEIMVVMTPDWLTNGTILAHDHLPLTLSLLQQAEPNLIWFNDFVHDPQIRPTILDLYPEWFMIIFAQSTVILIFWFWHRGKRFGPIEMPREWAVRFGDERIWALASWYKRGEFYKESLFIQEKYLRQILQEKWGIVSRDRKEWMETAERRLPPKSQVHWRQYYTEHHEWTDVEKISLKTFLKWSQRIDHMRKEVEHK